MSRNRKSDLYNSEMVHYQKQVFPEFYKDFSCKMVKLIFIFFFLAFSHRTMGFGVTLSYLDPVLLTLIQILTHQGD